MNRALWIAASGMESQQVMTDTIANNMANVNTTGYKQSVAHFQDMLYQTVMAPGSSSSAPEKAAGIQMGSGVKTMSVTKNFHQGTLKNSSSQLDLAIEGRGFFEVAMPDGTSGFSRAGSFHMSPTGQVVTAEGYQVVGFPVIEPEATSISITRDGTVTTVVGGVASGKGRIQLARFTNPEGLSSVGHSLYVESEASGTAVRGNAGGDGIGDIAQYFLEGSNVQIVKEMVDMIASQRAYELNSKGIKSADEMLRMASNLK